MWTSMLPFSQILSGIAVLSAAVFATQAGAEATRIVALGDSNTAGYRVGTALAFPAQLEAHLRGAGYDAQVVNAGISGDTTSGMLGRLDNSVPQGTHIVIVQGGYNDLRRGASPAAITANVTAILARLRARRIKAVLCGFDDYPWSGIARRYGAAFAPSGTCYDASYRGSDGLHMNAAGHQAVAARLFPVVRRLIAQP
jgi:acyl-CoA thioesterase I